MYKLIFFIQQKKIYLKVVPKWVEANPTTIATGSVAADQIIFVLLTTSMFVAGIIGFLLDNTIPGK